MYKLFYKMARAENAAPSKITIEDYEMDGEIKAGSRGEALRKWYLKDISKAERLRDPEVGDVIQDPMDQYFILTSSGLWCHVSLK